MKFPARLIILINVRVKINKVHTHTYIKRNDVTLGSNVGRSERRNNASSSSKSRLLNDPDVRHLFISFANLRAARRRVITLSQNEEETRWEGEDWKEEEMKERKKKKTPSRVATSDMQI